MPRVPGNWIGDVGMGDAYAWLGTDSWQFVATTAPVFTINAAGNYSWAFSASQTFTCIANLSRLGWQRTGIVQTAQEQFPGTWGPGPNAGAPPFTAGKNLVPLSAAIPKGTEIADLTLVYSIGTAALTSQTPLMKSALFANTAAVVVSAVTLSTATALATLSTTNPYVTKLSVVTPGYTVADLTGLTFQNTVVAGSGVYNLYGAFVHATFNYQ